MSSETNKLLCAVLTAFLFFLLASFVGELIYHSDEKKEISLSYKVGIDKIDGCCTNPKSGAAAVSPQ